MKLEVLLKKHFNFDTFKEGQKEVIASILSGNHTMAMLPTGTGKSLCYQLPAYSLEGQVVVVSPLLSLMQDQVEQMMMRGEKRVVAINSFLNKGEKKYLLERLGRYKFIFISPEMLTMETVIKELKQLKIALFVVDEAHCISQWGYDFRPDYMKLRALREKLGNPLTLALTATATKEVIKDITDSLQLNEWKEIIFSVDRPNISIVVEHVESTLTKQNRLAEMVSSIQGPGIIYFSSRKLAEDTVEFLRSRGKQRVMAYHGGLDQESRILIQQQFVHGQLDLICATSAFGMGINKDNVRFVIHYHMPLQLESYLQEIGRAGRDGKKSIAILLYAPGDERLPFQLAESELPNEDQVKLCFEWIHHNKESFLSVDAYEAEIRTVAHLTDIQWRMIRDYLLDIELEHLKELMDRFNEFINKRTELKRKKIVEMLEWTKSTKCRREKILNYFAEQKTIEVEDCCDICGIELKRFKVQEENMTEDDFLFHWKDYLKAILIK